MVTKTQLFLKEWCVLMYAQHFLFKGYFEYSFLSLSKFPAEFKGKQLMEPIFLWLKAMISQEAKPIPKDDWQNGYLILDNSGCHEW